MVSHMGKKVICNFQEPNSTKRCHIKILKNTLIFTAKSLNFKILVNREAVRRTTESNMQNHNKMEKLSSSSYVLYKITSQSTGMT